jgi:methylated-DNA-[protein]-cysteine S-methyltransferase
MIIEIAELATPIGALVLATLDARLCALGFADRWSGKEKALSVRFGGATLKRAPGPAGVVRRLEAYFAGAVDALDEIDVDVDGTKFQMHVWRILRGVPAGRTVSYGELARSIGAPEAARAVGAANAINPVALVIPCHRVIGSDGRLTGYGGGLERKQWLLTHEGATGVQPQLLTPGAGSRASAAVAARAS